MIPIDGILLGLTVVGFLVAVPLGMAITGLLLWATALGRNPRGRRATSR